LTYVSNPATLHAAGGRLFNAGMTGAGGATVGSAVGALVGAPTGGKVAVGAVVAATGGATTGAAGTIGLAQAARIPINMINNEIFLHMVFFLS
jgi:hypothetical protein